MRTRTFLVIAKNPVPGRVKTRLHAAFTPDQAAELAAMALTDTLDAVESAASAGVRRARAILVLDGDPAPWRNRSGLAAIVPQTGGGLDQRLEGAFDEAFARDAGPALLVGMDTPQLTPRLLGVRWRGADAVLGLSEDGGFWAVGLRRRVPGAFRGVPMSTPHTGADQLRRLRDLGLRVRLLPELRDVDTPDDAAAVAGLAPATRFARAHRRIRGPAPGRATLTLDLNRWNGPPDGADRLLLSRSEPPVLDLGCGPGRLVCAVAETGSAALGVDVSRAAVRLTAGRGASVLHRALEDPLPGHGRWGTVLLADGNIGIGGDPRRLLERCFTLLRPGGLLLVESDPDDARDTRERLVVVDDRGVPSPEVAWACVGSDALVRSGEGAGFVVSEEWRTAGRVFLAMRRPAVSARTLDPERTHAAEGNSAPGR